MKDSYARGFPLGLGGLLGLTGGLALYITGLEGPAAGPGLGFVLGVAFAALTAERARTAGSGLLWGLAGALLLWFAGLLPLASGHMPPMDAARAHFPELVGALLLFGAPLGLVLGAYRARVRVGSTDAAERFSLPRALVCGGLAGAVGGSVLAW